GTLSVDPCSTDSTGSTDGWAPCCEVGTLDVTAAFEIDEPAPCPLRKRPVAVASHPMVRAASARTTDEAAIVPPLNVRSFGGLLLGRVTFSSGIDRDLRIETSTREVTQPATTDEDARCVAFSNAVAISSALEKRFAGSRSSPRMTIASSAGSLD